MMVVEEICSYVDKLVIIDARALSRLSVPAANADSLSDCPHYKYPCSHMRDSLVLYRLQVYPENG